MSNSNQELRSKLDELQKKFNRGEEENKKYSEVILELKSSSFALMEDNAYLKHHLTSEKAECLL
jgi:small-conductance mechanosensitive channel